MPEQLSNGQPGKLWEIPTFADYIVCDGGWLPAEAGVVDKHKDGLGKTYASTEVDPGEIVSAKLAVKATKTRPANHTVLVATFPGDVQKKYIVTDIRPMREGPLEKFTCTMEYRASMPDPA